MLAPKNTVQFGVEEEKLASIVKAYTVALEVNCPHFTHEDRINSSEEFASSVMALFVLYITPLEPGVATHFVATYGGS